MLRIIGSKLLTVIALLSSVIAASADFSGSDNFNDNSKDLTKWGTDILTGTFGGAALNETNTRLEYTSTSATDIDVLRPWIANNGSFTSNWRLQIDVNVPTRTLSVGQAYGFEFGVRNSANVNDTFYVSLELNNFGTQTRSFFSTFDVNGVAQPPDAGSVTTSTSAALQIRYDAGTGTLFADFDADGATGGYSFTNFDSRSVTGWTAGGGRTFNAVVGGFTQGGLALASADGVSGDNFLAVPEPVATGILFCGMLVCLGSRSRTAFRRGQIRQ